MGRTASSSKRKSSKRKSSKLSHEDRKRKKSRRNKSKKHHHHRDDSDSDSDSSFSDKDSISSTSVSSYSSEDDYKSKKIRSSKSGRKKSMKSSSSKDSKKRKRSKKDIDTKPSKKSRKVKRKREVSISSESEESEKVRHRGRSRERKISKNKTRISKSRSLSISDDSYSRYNSDEEEIIMQNNINNNPMRLKSVITIVEPSERDSYKEEIVYDRDDYPSSRSNDSLDKKFSEEEIDHFNLKETGPIERETEISSTVVGPGNDDLELLLRQKALENLRKFRELKKNSSPVLETGKDGKDGNDPGVNIESIEKDIDKTISEVSEKGQISNCVEVVTLQGLAETNLVNTDNTENTLGDICSKELKDEVESSLKGVEEEIKDVGSGSSQFEKKTMSVMRGGEMVQVNYKVYIPKKVPALARRQLKR